MTRKIKEQIRAYINSGAVNKNLNAGNQNKHFAGHPSHIGTKSLLYGDMSTAQALIDMYSGTGDPLLRHDGTWNNKERIIGDKIVGVHINPETGIGTPTTNFIIHYGDAGAHVIPANPKGW